MIVAYWTYKYDDDHACFIIEESSLYLIWPTLSRSDCIWMIPGTEDAE